jgi:hypothetical protein
LDANEAVTQGRIDVENIARASSKMVAGDELDRALRDPQGLNS